MVSVEFNPLTPEARANPYPLYHQLREQQPVRWGSVMETWILSGYEDVVFVLTDDRFSADRRRARNRLAQAMVEQQNVSPLGQAATMLSTDPPDHTRLRGLVSKAFTPRMVERMRPHIQEIVDELLDAVQDAGRMDLIEDLAYPLPVIVIAEMLGIPPEERDQFKRWSNDLVSQIDSPLGPQDAMDRGRAAALEMAEYFRIVIAERRKMPKDDLISSLVAAEERGDMLSEEEMLATCMLLLAAGNETTTNLIGNGMLALLRHPDQLSLLRDDASLTASAVEEFLRYDGPVQATGRVAKEGIDVGGQRVEAGQALMVLLGAANRDPAVFANPDRLDITRQDNRHVAFGDGVHFCLGAPLARAEAQAAFATLLRRMPNLRLATDEPEWGGNFLLRGLKELPLTF